MAAQTYVWDHQTFKGEGDGDIDGGGYANADTYETYLGYIDWMLWKSGHAGVYIGGGYAIEAMGTRKGVVKTEVSGRGWQGWCKLPYIDYLEVE